MFSLQNSTLMWQPTYLIIIMVLHVAAEWSRYIPNLLDRDVTNVRYNRKLWMLSVI